MANYTSKVNLYKPNRNDDIDVDTSLADNFEKIDSEFSNVDNDFTAQGNSITALEKFTDNSKLTENDMQRITSTRRHYPMMLDTPTYEGSGEVVHPDVTYIPDGFGSQKWRYWMVMTPLPGRSDQFEDPSILVSHDGLTWDVPPGLTNPLVPSPGGSNDHNSDPCMLYLNGKLHLWYRETMKSVTPREQRIKYMTSTNGISWTTPQTAILDDSGNPEGLMAPTVIHKNGQFMMWYMDGKATDSLTKRTSTNGLNWSNPVKCSTTGMPSGRVYWHAQVNPNPDGRLDMIFASYPIDGSTGWLHYGYSFDDGKTWTTGPPFVDILYPHETQRFYRGCIRHVDENPNIYEIWYSSLGGASNAYRVSYMNAIRINNKLYPLSPSDRKYIFNSSIGVPSIHASTGAFQEITVAGQKVTGGKAPWVYASLLNGWKPNTDMEPRFYKNGFDEVNIAGRILPGTTSDGTTLFMLPEGYRPAYDMMFRQRFADVYCMKSGEVKVYGFGERYICLDGITYRTD